MNDKDICYKIYSEEFGDDEFSKELFNNCYKYCHYYKVDEKIVAITFLLPCEIIDNNIHYPAKYVFAVTTKKEYRGKGYMTKLLNSLYNDEEIFFLMPVNPSVIDFYKRIGYIEFSAIKSKTGEKYVSPCSDFLNLAKNYTDFTGNKYTLMYRCKKDIDINNLNFAYTME